MLQIEVMKLHTRTVASGVVTAISLEPRPASDGAEAALLQTRPPRKPVAEEKRRESCKDA